VVADLGPDLRDLADAVRVSTEVKLTRFSQVRLPRWHTRRVVLLGDSAHCLDPLSGQGAHAAPLGAVSLVEALGEHGGDHTSAFEQYESRTRPFVELTQQLTARVAEYVTRARRRSVTLRAGLVDVVRTLPSVLTCCGRQRLAGTLRVPAAGLPSDAAQATGSPLRVRPRPLGSSRAGR
jgi:2-polyprenyl-6-methoxyphenol hydroxylase-like FAD-dependent oxidoreductase